jgi:hypothetical protein
MKAYWLMQIPSRALEKQLKAPLDGLPEENLPQPYDEGQPRL